MRTLQTKPFLLVAEDDPDDQFLIQDAIAKVCPPDLETYFVWDGFELVKLLHEKVNGCGKPDLIVLDLNMPRKDGRTALQEIRANPDLASIPVVVLTTSNNHADVQYCQQYGVAGYYRKPGSLEELRKIIESLCSAFLDGKSKPG